MLLVVGLGNPGLRYLNTRHNIGFMLIDNIRETLNFPSFENKFNSHFTKLKIKNNNIILLKPQSFMNLSGIAVRECHKFFKIPTENIMVFHDDLDMEFLKVKIKCSGGDGGHNGIKNIRENIGDDFNRIKIGIRNSRDIVNVEKFVLGDFSLNEKGKVKFKIKQIVENIEKIFNKEFSNFLNEIKKNNGL